MTVQIKYRKDIGRFVVSNAAYKGGGTDLSAFNSFKKALIRGAEIARVTNDTLKIDEEVWRDQGFIETRKVTVVTTLDGVEAVYVNGEFQEEYDTCYACELAEYLKPGCIFTHLPTEVSYDRFPTNLKDVKVREQADAS